MAFYKSTVLLMLIGIVYALPTLLVFAIGMVTFDQTIDAVILAISVPFTVFSVVKMIDAFGYGIDNFPWKVYIGSVISALIAITLILQTFTF